MLILVATPIGNLGDFPYRAVETLKEVDLILCEDTRQSQKLLKAYEIRRPLQSFHKFNEAEREESILSLLKEGQTIALISDAGTPGISDPGQRLVARCRKEGLAVSALPGPCAAIQALVISGLPTDRFQFVGFLERKSGALRRQIAEILHYVGTSIAYESPHRLLKTLALVAEVAPDAPLAIARELTKLYEEVDSGTAQELWSRWKERGVKGEVVLLFGPYRSEWQESDPLDHMDCLQEELGLSRKEAMKLVAELRGLGRRELYQKEQNL